MTASPKNPASPPGPSQVGGDHYSKATGVCPHCRGEIQHWDWAGRLPGLVYAATKYIARFAAKDGFEGLKKAISYVEKIMAQEYPEEYAAWKSPATDSQKRCAVVSCAYFAVEDDILCVAHKEKAFLPEPNQVIVVQSLCGVEGCLRLAVGDTLFCVIHQGTRPPQRGTQTPTPAPPPEPPPNRGVKKGT